MVTLPVDFEAWEFGQAVPGSWGGEAEFGLRLAHPARTATGVAGRSTTGVVPDIAGGVGCGAPGDLDGPVVFGDDGVVAEVETRPFAESGCPSRGPRCCLLPRR